MDVTVIINRLLAEFATKYGLPSLALNQEGVAALCFDEQLQLSLILVPERDQLVLQADVGRAASGGRGDFPSVGQLQSSLVSVQSSLRFR